MKMPPRKRSGPGQRLDSVGPGRQSSHMAGRKDSEDWGRLGSYVRRRRLEPQAKARGRYFPDIRAFAEATGIHERTLGKLENGHTVGGNTLAAVEIALEWGPQSAKSILAGGEPTEVSSASQSSVDDPPLFDDVERKIWAALKKIHELPRDEALLYLDIHRGLKQRTAKPRGQTG